MVVKTGLSKFIAVCVASMLNPDFAILLKEGKGDKINLGFGPKLPELYKMPKHLWEMCLEGQDWLPPIKGKTYNLSDD